MNIFQEYQPPGTGSRRCSFHRVIMCNSGVQFIPDMCWSEYRIALCDLQDDEKIVISSMAICDLIVCPMLDSYEIYERAYSDSTKVIISFERYVLTAGRNHLWWHPLM